MNALSRNWQVLTASWALESQRRRARQAEAENHAFLPAALEVLERPPSPIGLALLWGMLAFVAAAFLWACLGRMDVVVSAPGKLIPSGHVQLVQSADGGVVRALHVRDGELVRKGQLLADLDPTQSGAEAAQAQAALATARMDAARSQALLRVVRGEPMAFAPPPGTEPAVAATQRALIESQLSEFRGKLGDLGQRRAEALAQARASELERRRLFDTLPLLRDRVARRRKLTDQGLNSKIQQLELEQQQLDHERSIGVQAEGVVRYAATAGSLAQQMDEARAAFVKEAATALAKAEDEVRLRTEELRKADQRSRLQQLRSPADGTIQQLSIHTIGAVVKPGDPIMVVVPAAGGVVMEAQLRNQDVGQVYVGQPVALKLEAFPFTRYGTVPGKLVGLSRDAIQDEKAGLIYQARVAVDPAWRPKGGIALSPGMAATADIHTGSRRIIWFLLSPIARRAQEAGREW